MKKVFNDRSFVSEVVVVDNTKFVNCRFEGCTLQYSGGPWGLEHCSFSPDTKLSFRGQAYSALMLLHELGMIKPSHFSDPSEHKTKKPN